MIQLNNICKTMGGETLIKDSSLAVEAGETVCLCGPSGIGKTTLLEIAAGLTAPDSGSVGHGSPRLGCAFQDDVLVPWLSALENLLLVQPSGTENAEAISRRWLKTFGLAPEMKPTRMSGGMRRRLSLARAFAVNPAILLLDEPFAFLDDHWQETVADKIEKHRAAGNAVLLVSHQMRCLATLQCRVITIPEGPIRLDA
ncbi:ATP-binding cassette domain-containing protein [Salidesulfovibrio onnuriiensis]|uniref:ATP-binding cassette domain-containing protein n=1 Tax=Salidesulfovibrio onnuriiensis TaxID=2583823 RepID=UPI0011CC1E8C|nr:ATP-binding cassette domain-containing protein [Salidesulfovibrio onnuriiensis]